MESSFARLSTEKLRLKLRPYAIKIYQQVFGNCQVVDFDHNQQEHILDKHFGIDALLYLPSGQFITLQEKYRDNDVLSYLQRMGREPEFTQEWMNACGTRYEQQGEWFHLASQIYFYGWANLHRNGFAKWLILDVVKYKILVEESGGLSKLGSFHRNSKHGRASFYAIPVSALQPAILTDYRRYVRKAS